jgi:hypothetical protein
MPEQNSEVIAATVIESPESTNSTPKVIRRKGSGRTKGSYSFVKVSLADLVAKFSDSNTPIVVGRIWAQSCGFNGVKSAPVASIIEQVQGATPNTAPAISVQVLD